MPFFDNGLLLFFFFNDTATTEIYTLSLHDALPILHDIVFHEVMASRLGLPVVVDNDANCAALCEVRVGVGAGCSELVLLTLGTGIGGGLVLGGEVYRGWLGGGAEMGHMVVVMDGPPCQGHCPNRGCL